MTTEEKVVARIDTLTRVLAALHPWRCKYGQTDDVINKTCEWLLKEIEGECIKLVTATKGNK